MPNPEREIFVLFLAIFTKTFKPRHVPATICKVQKVRYREQYRRKGVPRLLNTQREQQSNVQWVKSNNTANGIHNQHRK